MKKLLGISIVAMLAVTPMMANAAQTAANLAATSGTEQNAIATTSYVKGAYNAVKAAHDAVVSDITVGSGTHYHITAGNSVAENLGELDTAVHQNDEKIGTITTLQSSTTFGQDEDHSDVVNAIISTKTQANATDALVGSSASSLTTEFGSGVDTVDKALKKLKEGLGATDSKGVVVYNGWNGGGTPNGNGWVGLTAEPQQTGSGEQTGN